MARFYFDFHDGSRILRDVAGEELPSATFAREEALRYATAMDLCSGSPQLSKRPGLKGKALPRRIVILLAGINEAAVDQATAGLAASGDLLSSQSRSETCLSSGMDISNRFPSWPIRLPGEIFTRPRGAARAQIIIAGGSRGAC
jgi:hypothetical protein